MDILKGALCLEGGSLRGLFTAGVLDAFLDSDLYIEYVNGVSAGSMNGMNYVSKQRGRSKRINLKYLHDKRYISFRNMFTSRQIFNFDFLFGDISNKYDPFDWDAFNDKAQRYEAVATDVITGESAYFNKDSCSDIIAAVEASSSIPVMSKMIDVDGRKYLDGGISTSIAYNRAFELGYSKVVAVLTREEGYRKKPVNKVNESICKRYFKPLPKLVDKLMTVPKRYNEMQEEMDMLANEGRLLIIRPPKKVIVQRLEKSVAKLESLYKEGYEEGMKNIENVRKFLS
ncbi:phospholipase, patatin family [Lachnoanaerobaculum saburreum F0468]|jgi:phospholipase, patatin family|uniref:Phospholipase, patatin family n=1 Tax=Lachnoanaerobaculum saburreum F0468 TaxID=1095750 RepID=I0R4G6_9FIRM|nr:patatin family protein [Lachnoanaerobaculum saburreum]EIC94574.1 phospholipase, patatin family [Lachnoanaerobaculum saburreum F0468]